MPADAQAGIGAPARVSVVIPAWNAEKFLPDCLASVRAQAGPFSCEVIVIDDGSTDGTADVAVRQPGVKLLRQSNQGPAGARNAGIDASSGELIAFLDADDLWPPGKLATQIELLHRHGDVAMVFGDCRQFDEHGPRARTEFESNGLGQVAWCPGPIVPDAWARLLRDNFITTGSVVVRRAVLAQVGGFATDLRLVEDLDLWLRIARRYPIAWCSETCLLRRRHAANASADAEAMGLAYLQVLQRHTPSGAAPRSLVSMIACLEAEEYRSLSNLALARGRPRQARDRALRGLSARVTPQGVWQLLCASAHMLRSPAGTR